MRSLKKKKKAILCHCPVLVASDCTWKKVQIPFLSPSYLWNLFTFPQLTGLQPCWPSYSPRIRTRSFPSQGFCLCNSLFFESLSPPPNPAPNFSWLTLSYPSSLKSHFLKEAFPDPFVPQVTMSSILLWFTILHSTYLSLLHHLFTWLLFVSPTISSKRTGTLSDLLTTASLIYAHKDCPIYVYHLYICVYALPVVT